MIHEFDKYQMTAFGKAKGKTLDTLAFQKESNMGQ
jgi:hypothetical protein